MIWTRAWEGCRGIQPAQFTAPSNPPCSLLQLVISQKEEKSNFLLFLFHSHAAALSPGSPQSPMLLPGTQGISWTLHHRKAPCQLALRAILPQTPPSRYIHPTRLPTGFEPSSGLGASNVQPWEIPEKSKGRASTALVSRLFGSLL